MSPSAPPDALAALGAKPFAHRGRHSAERGSVENSRAAFEAAIAEGYGIELDVQLSRDGVAMVFHDAELDRLTGEAGQVAERNADDLGRVRLREGGETIPRLVEVLDQVAGRAPLLIEAKAPRGWAVDLASAAADALEGYTGPHGVMSFNPEVPAWFRRYRPDQLRGLVISRAQRLGIRGDLGRRFAMWRARPSFLAADVRDLPYPLTARARSRRVPVYAWTVRTPAAEAIVAAHADQRIFERV